MAFVRRKGRKFYIVTSVRTAAGPRQRCEYVACGPMSCPTLLDLREYLISKAEFALRTGNKVLAKSLSMRANLVTTKLNKHKM